MSRLSREVAEAVISTSLLPTYTRAPYQDELVRTAKRLQRLQTRRGSLKRHLKAVEADIRFTKRELKALCQTLSKGE